MDTPGPLERRATQAFYYVTPPDAGLAPDKLEQYLEAYYFPGLEIISIKWWGLFRSLRGPNQLAIEIYRKPNDRLCCYNNCRQSYRF